MFSSVSAWFTWIIEYLPDFLLSSPVIELLGLGVAVLVVALVARLIRVRF